MRMSRLANIPYPMVYLNYVSKLLKHISRERVLKLMLIKM